MKQDERLSGSENRKLFLQKLSHDIRSPLGAILGFNDLLRANDLSAAEVEQFTAAVDRNARLVMTVLEEALGSIGQIIGAAPFEAPTSVADESSSRTDKKSLTVWPSILVVEDSADTRELISIVASDLGSPTISAGDAGEAIRLLEAGPAPDLILLDLTLPGMTGAEFLTTLRSDERWKKIKVILLSGWDNLAQKAIEMGADGSLKKPFDVDNIEDLIRQHAT